MNVAADEPPRDRLDRRLWPTRGVAGLIGEALVDLLLLPLRLIGAILFAHRRRRAMAELIRTHAHASQDAHPAR